MNAKRLSIALIASLSLRYPVWLFMTNAGHLQKVKAWQDSFKLLCNWDCSHYVRLTGDLEPHAFFPLFPLVSRLLWLGLSAVTAASATLAVLITSNVFTIIGGALTLYLGDRLWDEPPTQKVLGFSSRSWLLLIALSLFPSSHFWVRGYTEPLFYTLLVAGLLALSHHRPLLASIFLGLTAVTRPPGIWTMGVLAGAFLLAKLRPGWIKDPRLNLSGWQLVAALALLVSPFCLFLIWNAISAGDPLHFLRLQSAWGRKMSLGMALYSHLPQMDRSSLYLYASLAATVYLFLRKEAQPLCRLIAALTLLNAEVPLLSGGFYSYHRFMSVNLGLFILLTELGAKKPRLYWAWIIWSLAQLGAVAHRVSFGGWTG